MPDPFPWGDRTPPGGYKLGDHVGLIYSDHEEYIFDNPTGTVIGVSTHMEDGEPTEQWLTVSVSADVTAEMCYLIERASAEVVE